MLLDDLESIAYVKMYSSNVVLHDDNDAVTLLWQRSLRPARDLRLPSVRARQCDSSLTSTARIFGRACAAVLYQRESAACVIAAPLRAAFGSVQAASHLRLAFPEALF
jgi:hypothetical protein